MSRIFSEGDASEWVLKGGAGMLARIPSTRSTLDIDLYQQGFTLTQALNELRRLAAVDLGDHFRFEYVGHHSTIGAGAQPYTEGCRVTFAVFIGVAQKGTVKIDLAVGAGLTGKVQAIRPATALDLPRLIGHRYRLYPVVDQIADKVCATVAEHNGQASSCEKDLVDLVVLAVTQAIDGKSLTRAIETERMRRKMQPNECFTVPDKWGAGYVRLSKPISYCARFTSVSLALALVSSLIDPALSSAIDEKVWSPERLQWE
nr:nucleotidyl transferase AbiEii/AbiGii toxin family protein [Leucobacter chinensis]